MVAFPDRLKKLRTDNGLTQKALAEAVGMSEAGLQNYEIKTSRPNLKNLIALANYFDVSLDYLTGRTDIKNP
ncbi:MAG: helix-turn-helix domain-containing protein [Defluviitaleaceae bacterium]|nr:helix-turn-helix domain-containing protein [Defluviitaleaceae bacterium]